MINTGLFGLRIVVLAAGRSSRMGRSKAFVRIRGVSLIRRTVATLAPFAKDPIIVVTTPRARRIGVELRGLPVELVSNSLHSQGLSSSVIRGLRAARYSRAALLLPMDLADLDPRDIARLISRWIASRRRVTARRLGNGPATPLIVPRTFYAKARGISGDVGLRDLVAEMPAECRRLVELRSAARDVDTPVDLQSARRRARR